MARITKATLPIVDARDAVKVESDAEGNPIHTETTRVVTATGGGLTVTIATRDAELLSGLDDGGSITVTVE